MALLFASSQLPIPSILSNLGFRCVGDVAGGHDLDFVFVKHRDDVFV